MRRILLLLPKNRHFKILPLDFMFIVFPAAPILFTNANLEEGDRGHLVSIFQNFCYKISYNVLEYGKKRERK